MKKIIKIEGMKCEHCQKKVQDALTKLNISKVLVNLDKKTATVKTELEDSILRKAIEDNGFKVVDITIKKGLF